MTTIGLCMIVKNESKVITRCLDSVRPLVDYVMIEDTGSTDGTQQLITGWLERAAMPGMVIEEPWRDFAYNRSHVLVKLRELEQIDYALIIDADDLLVLPKDFDPAAFKAGMRDDLYDVQIRHGGSRFYRPQICANKLPFCFKAVLHEYLEAPAGPLSRSERRGVLYRDRPRRRPKRESDEVSGRCRDARQGSPDRNRTVPDLPLHVLCRPELSGLWGA